MTAFVGDKKTANGKTNIIFHPPIGSDLTSILLPCGQCIGCRLEKSRQWAIRMSHENQMSNSSCFLTLTYNEEHLPETGTLILRDVQLFMKKLRKKISIHDITYRPSPKTGKFIIYEKILTNPIKFFLCGEYGEKNRRPHYHICIFNYDFPDKKLFRISNDVKLYVSPMLEDLWGKGFCTIGDVTFESAAYVARYITKKITGPRGADHYLSSDPETGEIHQLKPEFATMSRNPGLGTSWLKKYKSDVYPDDFIVIRGKKMKPPKFYDLAHEKEHAQKHEDIEFDRYQLSIEKACNNTPERLIVRESILKTRLKLLPRNLEKE